MASRVLRRIRRFGASINIIVIIDMCIFIIISSISMIMNIVICTTIISDQSPLRARGVQVPSEACLRSASVGPHLYAQSAYSEFGFQRV